MPVDIAVRELQLARNLGFDHVRLWLSAFDYDDDPAALLTNLRLVLDIAHRYGLSVVMELFDSCGVELETGPVNEVLVEDVPALVEPDDATLGWYGSFPSGDAIMKASALVPVPFRGTSAAVIWEWWASNPGYFLLGEEHWPRWEAFADAIVGLVRNHPALLLLEVMNEPFVTSRDVEARSPAIRSFYTHFHGLIRDLAPEVPLSIGAGGISTWPIHDEDLHHDLDVVSFHSYSPPDTMAEEVRLATGLAHGRPLYLSEWGHFPGSDDADQLSGIQALLPVVELRDDMANAFAHLVSGYGPFGLNALCYPNGIMRPAGLAMREHLRGRGPVVGK